MTAADATSLCRDANDVAAAAIRTHPNRFRAMATLPLADPSVAARELERPASLGLTGAMVYGRIGDVRLDDPRFEDVWAVAARLRQPIFIHPQIPAGTAALRLMARGVLDRHPDLQLILGHWGELLLFRHQRADSLARISGLDRSITEYLQQNVWITASGMLDAALLRHALAVTTPDRILFSTDYPFQSPTRREIDEFLTNFADDESRIAFSSGNARQLFTIT